MIFVTTANRFGIEVAKTLQGTFRAVARRDSGKVIIKTNPEEKKKNQKKGKFTSCKNGLATKKGCDLVVRQDDQAHILLLGDLRWSGHREI